MFSNFALFIMNHSIGQLADFGQENEQIFEICFD
jgi:hypothetical protein